jgi:GT2 family glycosyltransferase
MSVKVAAVIVTYNNAAGIERLLSDLYGQSLRPDTVWVIDNARDDATARVIAQSPQKVDYVRLTENSGSAGGYAEGLSRAQAGHDLIWLLDDDVALEPDSLETLVQAYIQLQSRIAPVAVRSWCTHLCPFPAARETSSFAWRGTMIPAGTVGQVGLPRRDYFLYADDAEYALRMRKAGYRIFWIPQSRVIEQRHEDKTSVRLGRIDVRLYRSPARLYYAFRNQLHLAISHRQRWLLVRTLGYALKLLVLLSARGRLTGPLRRAVWLGLCDGWAARLGKHPEYGDL